VKDINTHLLRKFKDLFEKTPDGKRIDWVKVTEEDIEKMWETCRKRMDPYFDLFEFVRLN
jgi:hypothetical protein